MDLLVHPFFDDATASWSYVIANPGSGCCAVVDPVLDCDPEAGRLCSTGADRIVELIRANGYTVEWILETHVHADHVSAAPYLRRRFVCAQIAIGAGVVGLQKRLADELGLDIATDGRQFDRLLDDGERVCLGHTCGRVVHTPGHTPACASYVFERFAFIGDTLFAPDGGTARCDFPGGDAAQLYRSVQRLYELPNDTRLLLCHDYPPEDRDRRFWVPVAEQRRHNRMLRDDTSEAEFAAARRERDAGLGQPRLAHIAIPVNLAGGGMPGPVAGVRTHRSAAAESAGT